MYYKSFVEFITRMLAQEAYIDSIEKISIIESIK